MSTAEIRLVRNYDRAAWFYETSAAVFSGGQIRASKKYTAAQVKAGQKVIFLGVGTGEEAIIAAQRGAHVTCLDISSGMLERLEARMKRRGLKAEILCQDAFQHDRLGYYDAVAANYFLNVFRHDDMQRMLKHAAGLVRPGGKFMVADVALARGNPLSRIFNLVYLKTAMATFWTLGLVPLHRNYDYAQYFSDAQLKLNHIRYFRLFKGGPVVFQTWVATKKKSR
jgi:demethylmenaquinone methyltransferase/2-methoxy-6-polyprenyl-1,4-benzoquinol methylase